MQPNSANHSESDPEYNYSFNYLIEQTKNVKAPLNVNQLANDLKGKIGMPPAGVPTFGARIAILRGKIERIEAIDTDTKVRMAFGLSIPITKKFLEELQKNAQVEVDDRSRITKYRALNGSLELEGVHQNFAKRKRLSKKQRLRLRRRIEQEESEKAGKTPESTKRPAEEVSSSSPKRTRNSSPSSPVITPLNSAPVDIQHPPQSPLNLKEKNAHVIPKAPALIKIEEPEEPEQVRTHTPQIKFLETIQSLVLTLDTPTLSLLQARIQRKIRESSDKVISNEEMVLAMELLVARITNHSTTSLPENVESVSLPHFFCFLRTVILSGKLGGLQTVLEKINERIREPSLKDKNIPMEKVSSVLRDTLNNANV